MGLYTEILLRTTLKAELDSNTESVLNFLFNNGSEQPYYQIMSSLVVTTGP